VVDGSSFYLFCEAGWDAGSLWFLIGGLRRLIRHTTAARRIRDFAEAGRRSRIALLAPRPAPDFEWSANRG